MIYGLLALMSVATFALGLGILGRFFRIDLTVLAVASVLLKEALRRRIAIICGGILLVALALLPLTISMDNLLHY